MSTTFTLWPSDWRSDNFVRQSGSHFSCLRLSPRQSIFIRETCLPPWRFYSGFGFIESFRTPTTGDPVHVELKLNGFTLGFATLEAARADHGLNPAGEGRWIEIVIWTDDTDAALTLLAEKGAPVISPAHNFLNGRLRVAWVADPDGNPIQLVQRKA
jgi:catechol 2,3-dioxygenase-like lactoylglutathione lyase family enzyme